MKIIYDMIINNIIKNAEIRFPHQKYFYLGFCNKSILNEYFKKIKMANYIICPMGLT